MELPNDLGAYIAADITNSERLFNEVQLRKYNPQHSVLKKKDHLDAEEEKEQINQEEKEEENEPQTLQETLDQYKKS